MTVTHYLLSCPDSQLKLTTQSYPSVYYCTWLSCFTNINQNTLSESTIVDNNYYLYCLFRHHIFNLDKLILSDDIHTSRYTNANLVIEVDNFLRRCLGDVEDVIRSSKCICISISSRINCRYYIR